MPLSPGTRLGSYIIAAPIGAGGMGEVYRAHDTMLGRDVAIKTLPDRLADDPERLARFRREAQVLAALNHPGIASIYGIEVGEGSHTFLVLELVDGETLAARIARGPLPVAEALRFAREIAQALAAAHDRGIVHRDLKPSNVALTSSDRVKVLDFGLAKAVEPAGPGDPENSPTITSPATLTGLGVVLGTAAYMSPEQAKGRAADKRSDIWAFGCVLYEMLTARRAFGGEDVSDTLAAVLRSDPDWSALPTGVPAEVRVLLKACLQKNPNERVGDISTVLFVLDHPSAPVAPGVLARRASRWMWLVPAAAVLVAAAGAAALWPERRASPVRVARFALTVPGTAQLTLSRRVLSISPDGSRIVYSADGRLHLRPLNSLESTPIPGAESAIHPTFSPDGQSVVFWNEKGLNRISVNGGVPLTVAATQPAPFGIHWSANAIVYAQPGAGIMRVSPDGGTPEVLVRTTPAEGVVAGPQLLPDGETVLFTLAPSGARLANFWEQASIVVQSLRTGARTTVMQGASEARYLPTGHLVYMVEGTMMAVPFDLDRRQTTGSPIPVVEGVRRSAASAGYGAQADIAPDGTLAYVPGPARAGHDDVYIYDRAGEVVPLKLPRGAYAHPRVSPDGKRLALEVIGGKGSAIALYELSGASALRRITFGGLNQLPLWYADGKHIIFQSDREGDLAIYRQPVEGGAAERLTRAGEKMSHAPEAWVPGHDMFLYGESDGTQSTLWIYSLADRRATRFGDLVSVTFPFNAAVSPDGKWVAYQTGDGVTGEATTYVEPFPPTGVKHELGRGGRAMWSRDGSELFFTPAPSQFFVVTVRTTPEFSFSPPRPVIRRFGLAPPSAPRPTDMLPDGRLVAVDAVNLAGDQRTQQMHVVLNWFEELRARMPMGR